MAETLHTERLTMTNITERDAAAFMALVSNPNVAIPAGFKPVRGEFEAQMLLRQMLNQRWIWGVFLNETGALIGTIGLYGRMGRFGRQISGERDLGYMLNEDFWGNGYMTEAVTAVLKFGFDHGLQTVWGSYFNDNVRSARIFARQGFAFDHQIVHDETDFFAPGKTESFYYLTRTDY